jgi:hypothetical protein
VTNKKQENMHMRRTTFAVVAAAALILASGAANAVATVSVSIVPNATGGTITLTGGSDPGDNATSYAIGVSFQGGPAEPAGLTGSIGAVSVVGGSFAPPATGQCLGGPPPFFCIAAQQVAASAVQLPTSFSAVIELAGMALGETASFELKSPAFNFGGIVDTTIYEVTAIPEPTTAALLGLGLLGLAITGRPRR